MALINDNYFLRKKERSETMLEINLTFKGYYSPTDPNIPESTGIYCIYKTELEEKANDGHNGGQYRDWQKRIITAPLYIGKATERKASDFICYQ